MLLYSIYRLGGLDKGGDGRTDIFLLFVGDVKGTPGVFAAFSGAKDWRIYQPIMKAGTFVPAFIIGVRAILPYGALPKGVSFLVKYVPAFFTQPTMKSLSFSTVK